MAENDNSTRLFPGLSGQLRKLEQQPSEPQDEATSAPGPAAEPKSAPVPRAEPSDNVVSLRKAARRTAPKNWSVEDIRHFPWRRALVLTVLVLLLAAVIVLAVWGQTADLDALRRSYAYRGVERDARGLARQVTLSDEYEMLGAMGRRTAIASRLGLQILDEDGTGLASVVATLTEPTLVTGPKLSLVYDAGGTTVCLANSAMQTETIRTAQPLLAADVAENGSFCYLTAAEADKTVLTVHSEQFSEVFSWFSRSRYLTTAALSDGGDLVAAIGAGSRDGIYWSSLLLLRTDRETPVADVALGESVVLRVDWIDEVCVLLCHDRVQFYSETGELLAEYALGERTPTAAAVGDGYLALCLTEGRARDTLLTLRTDGTVLGELALGREADRLSAAGPYVALLTPQGLSVYTSKLTVYGELTETGSLRDCHVRKDGTVLLTTGQGTALYLP